MKKSWLKNRSVLGVSFVINRLAYSGLINRLAYSRLINRLAYSRLIRREFFIKLNDVKRLDQLKT